MNIKKYFRSLNTTNSLVSHNISTNHIFDFRGIIETCSIFHFDTVLQNKDFIKYHLLEQK